MLTATAFFAVCHIAAAQSLQPLPEPAFIWHCAGGGAEINHNPANSVAGGPLVSDSVPYAKDYTVIAVCMPSVGSETALWSLDYGGSLRALTTERIISDSATVRYARNTSCEPQINTLRQTAPDSVRSYTNIVIGGSGAARFAELHYYTHRLGGADLRRIQSALALRYGVTLGPVDYVDGAGRIVWNHGDREYHHRVAGVGMDTVTGLCQALSRSEMEGGMLSLGADSVTHGMFLVTGDNAGPLTLVPDSVDGSLRLSRIWRAQGTGTEGRLFTLTFGTADIEPHVDSLILVLSDGRAFLPDSVLEDRVVYTGIPFPSGETLFTLAHGGMSQRMSMANIMAEGGLTTPDGHGGDTAAATTRLYPNPTSGRYTIEVTGATHVRVTIYTPTGTPVASYSSDDCGRCRFDGELPTGSVYYATVETEAGNQTMKIVVK